MMDTTTHFSASPSKDREAENITLVPGAEMAEREGLRKIVEAHSHSMRSSSGEVEEPSCSTRQLEL